MSPSLRLRIAPLKLPSIVIVVTILTVAIPSSAQTKMNQASFVSQDPQVGSSSQTESALLHPTPPLPNAERPSQLVVAPIATPNPKLTSWIPPDIDTVMPSVATGVECSLPQVVSGVGRRMTEFIDSLQKIEARETVEHFKVDAAGSRGKPQTR